MSEPTAAEPPSPHSRRRLFIGIAFCLATLVVSVQAVRLTKPPPELDLTHYAPAGEVESDTPPVRLAAAPPRQPRSWPPAVRTIVIDAGHGGKSHGTQLPSGLNEKDLVLSGGTAWLNGLPARLEAALRSEGGARVRRVKNPTFACAHGRLLAAKDLEADAWEQLATL